MTFQQLQLIDPLLRAVKEEGYTTPSPIQQQAIPVLLEGRDLIGCAQTGTGKTAAFALPILQLLRQKEQSGIRALILTPTRELALQIDESFLAYGKYMSLRTAVIFGGVGQKPQVDALKRGVDILVATPGRLNDLIGQGFVDLSHLEIFVLDEADRMLDMGFINDVKRVLRRLPSERQTLLFSATMPDEIEYLAKSMLRDPQTVKVDAVNRPVDAIRQCIYFIDKGNKKLLLRDLVKSGEIKNALVFTRTKHGADRVVRELNSVGIQAMAIHGNKSQTARQDALNRFKDGKLRILVATDIAARGIDVPELSHVINYELPNEAEVYIHRIGRTGRAGLGGDAVSFCSSDEMGLLADIENLTGSRIPEKESPYPLTGADSTGQKPQRYRGKGGSTQPSKVTLYGMQNPEQVLAKTRAASQSSDKPQMYARIDVPAAAPALPEREKAASAQTGEQKKQNEQTPRTDRQKQAGQQRSAQHHGGGQSNRSSSQQSGGQSNRSSSQQGGGQNSRSASQQSNRSSSQQKQTQQKNQSTAQRDPAGTAQKQPVNTAPQAAAAVSAENAAGSQKKKWFPWFKKDKSKGDGRT
ncbi:MAG: DEAD/DEAH box helicase [Oscillospiraceae bacterium]|nr:DEAD/DEAH box helicase [Oscillospiraceae bacterium]